MLFSPCLISHSSSAEEGAEVSGRPAALPSPRLASDGPNRDPFAPRRSSDWSGKPSQVFLQSPMRLFVNWWQFSALQELHKETSVQHLQTMSERMLRLPCHNHPAGLLLLGSQASWCMALLS